MSEMLVVFEADHANCIKTGIAAVTPHVLKSTMRPLNGRLEFAICAVSSLVDMAEAICVAADWEYRRESWCV